MKLLFLCLTLLVLTSARSSNGQRIQKGRRSVDELEESSCDKFTLSLIHSARPTTGIAETEIFQVGTGSGVALLKLAKESASNKINVVTSSTSELASFNELMISTNQPKAVNLMKSANPYGAITYLVQKSRQCDILIQEQFSDSAAIKVYKTAEAYASALIAAVRDEEGEELIFTHLSETTFDESYHNNSYIKTHFGSSVYIKMDGHIFVIARRGGIQCRDLQSSLYLFATATCSSQ